jgi:iron complex transport system ATP-binding protein
MTLLVARDVTVALQRAPVLRGATLSVAPGEFVGLAGPNGAGKTTFLRAAAGLLRVSGGDLQIAGRAPDSYGHRALARTVAYLAHGAPAHWPMSVERVVSLGRLPHTSAFGSLTADDERIVDEALRESEVTELASRSVSDLSEGERARVMIARALAQQPKLLLADEPTASLDPYHQLRVLELLRGVAARGGAVLAVFHDLPLAVRYCSRLALLVEGRVLTQGTPDEVLTPENIRAAYGVEMQQKQAPVFTLP